MPHIHTQPGQYDHTISMYLFRTDFSEPKIMLHLHRKIGLYAQFGGHIELDESPWHAAMRELREETGYDSAQVIILQPAQRITSITDAVVHPQPIAHITMHYPVGKGHFHTDSVYAFTTTEPPRFAPGEGESTDIGLFSRSELVKLGTKKVDRITYDIALQIFDNYLDNWSPVSTDEFIK